MKDNGLLKQFTKKDLVIILLVIFFLFLLPLVFTTDACWQMFDFSETGSIGDTIGGITAPFIGLLAAYLVYKSFEVQYEANRIHSEALKKQSDNQRMDRILDSFMRLYQVTQEKYDSFKDSKYIGKEGVNSFKLRIKSKRGSYTDNHSQLHSEIYFSDLDIVSFNSIIKHLHLMGKVISNSPDEFPETEMLADIYIDFYRSRFEEIIQLLIEITEILSSHKEDRKIYLDTQELYFLLQSKYQG